MAGSVSVYRLQNTDIGLAPLAKCPVCAVKAKFHDASWFGASSEPASVMEFGFTDGTDEREHKMRSGQTEAVDIFTTNDIAVVNRLPKVKLKQTMYFIHVYVAIFTSQFLRRVF